MTNMPVTTLGRQSNSPLCQSDKSLSSSTATTASVSNAHVTHSHSLSGALIQSGPNLITNVSSETFQRIQNIKNLQSMFVAAAIGEMKICSVSPHSWFSAASWTGSAEDTLRSLGFKKNKKQTKTPLGNR